MTLKLIVAVVLFLVRRLDALAKRRIKDQRTIEATLQALATKFRAAKVEEERAEAMSRKLRELIQ